MEISFLNYFLPEKLLEHFVITQVEELGCVSTKKMILQIRLEEINRIPLGYDDYFGVNHASDSGAKYASDSGVNPATKSIKIRQG